jgi:hypothetical protein
LLPLQRSFDVRGKLFALARLALGLLRLEFRHHLRGEALERFADVLVPVASTLLDEHGLVHARVRERAQRGS